MNNKHYQVFLMYRKKILENETTGEDPCWRPAPYLLYVFSNEFINALMKYF